MEGHPDLSVSVDSVLFVVLDVETTGLSPSSDRICEIGAVKLIGGKIIDEFSTLINPGIPLPSYVHYLTGITQEELNTAPTFDDIAPQFLAFISDAVLVAHNAPFDIAFISSHLEAHTLPSTSLILDTVSMAKRLSPGTSYSLDALIQRLGIHCARRHRALPDARATAELFTKLIKRIGKKDLILQDLLPFSVNIESILSDSLRVLRNFLKRCIESNIRLKIVYASPQKGEVTERVILPKELKRKSLRAYCYLRQDERNFYLSRILKIEPVDPLPDLF